MDGLSEIVSGGRLPMDPDGLLQTAEVNRDRDPETANEEDKDEMEAEDREEEATGAETAPAADLGTDEKEMRLDVTEESKKDEVKRPEKVRGRHPEGWARSRGQPWPPTEMDMDADQDLPRLHLGWCTAALSQL